MKQYAIIQNYEDFREVELLLIKAGVNFGTNRFNDGFAFIFYTK